MKLDKEAAITAYKLAIPFVSIATYLWLVARAHNYQGPEGNEYDLLGELIFKLGSPLTLIVLMFPKYAGRLLSASDDWWAISLVVSLFILQWVIWSQVIAWLSRRLPG